MCKFCQNYDKETYEMELGDVFITQSAKYTYEGDGREYSVPLNFCPACGRALFIGFRDTMTAAQRPCETCCWNRVCGDSLFKYCSAHNWCHHHGGDAR